MLKNIGIACVAVSAVLALATGASAQTSSSNIADLLAGLTPDQLSQLTSLLGSGSTSGLSSLLGGTTTTQPATSQPSVSNRVGPPSTMINAAIAEHIQFNNVAFNMTPTQQATALGITTPAAQTKIPIIYLFKALVTIGAKYIPALQGLANLLNGIMPSNPGTPTVTPPTSVTNKGLVAYVTADDTALTVGQTTTGRLWVEQTSPTTANDNGVYSVAVDIDASPAAIIQSTVPVTLVSPWDVSLVPTLKGTATGSGGISGIASVQGAIPPNASLGIGAPIQVANFTITAKSAGTVTLTPTNFSGSGYTGINPVGSGANGDEANYVPVQITVQ